MKKIILIILSLLVIIGLWALIHRQNTAENTANNLVDGENVTTETSQVSENGQLVIDEWAQPFLRSDLTESEKQDLAVILEQRKERLQQMRDILDNAYKSEDGNMEQAWEDVQAMRDKCKERIAPYIAEDKLSEFNLYCYNQAEEMDADYVQK